MDEYTASNAPNKKSDPLQDRPDYTKWQRQFFDEMEPGEFHDKAVEYARNHPYTGKAERL